MAILQETKNQHQEENTQILKTLLDYRFFLPWKGFEKYNNTEKSIHGDTELELYITSQCNQQCSYCYLHKHPELYPVEYQVPEKIINNLKMLYDYIMIENYYIPTLRLFSGEIWHTSFGYEILQITLNYIQKGMKIDKIILPSNGTFLRMDESFQKMQAFVEKFDMIGHPLKISFSIDGKLIDDKRAGKDTDEFYDRILAFARNNGFLFHPMISAQNIYQWQENFQWWQKQLKYFNYSIDAHKALMMLEVRNDDWNDNSISAFCDFIQYLMNDYLKNHCDNNIYEFADRFCCRKDINDISNYVPWGLPIADTFPGCTISSNLTVRLGDLAICPCHRTAYEQYLYGHFTTDGERITGVKAQNPQMAIHILMGNILCSNPVCDQCVYNKVCLHGCYGSQLETLHDPFFPIPSVCALFKAKYHTILEYLRDRGIIDYYKTISPQEPNYYFIKHILTLEELEREGCKNGMGTCKNCIS